MRRSAARGERMASTPPTGNSFVLGSYLRAAPTVVEDEDVQPLTQQLAEFFNDPLHDPLVHGRNVIVPGNTVPGWMRPVSTIARAVAVARAWLPPTSCCSPPIRTRKTIFRHRRLSSPMQGESRIICRTWRCCPGMSELRKVSAVRTAFRMRRRSPSRQAMPGGRTAWRRWRWRTAPPKPTVAAVPSSGSPNGHRLIGYWAGYGAAGSTFPLREVSPQWDVILVAFATPDRNAPEGTMQFHTPAGLDPAAVQGRHCLFEEPGEEGHDLARRRRPALHARRSGARAELCLLGYTHRHGVRLRRDRHRL